MAMTLELRGRIYEVVSGTTSLSATSRRERMFVSPRLQGERVSFDSDYTARRFLTRALEGATSVHKLRRLLTTRLPTGVVSRMTDAEVVEHLALRIGAGDLRVYAAPIPRPVYEYEVPEEAEEAAQPEEADERYLMAWVEGDAEPHELEASVSGDAEPEELEASIDQDAEDGPVELDDPAQVDALRAAAATGTPFCEECAKAREALKTPPASSPEAEEEEAAENEAVDAPAQAATLRQAAAKGAPFCEECEKARLAAKQAPPAAPAASEDAEEEAGSPDAARVDAPTQAATMRSAAEAGLPFCEECEKARRAQHDESSS